MRFTRLPTGTHCVPCLKVLEVTSILGIGRQELTFHFKIQYFEGPVHMEAGDRGKLRNLTRVVKKSLSSHATQNAIRGDTCNMESLS